MPHFLTFNRRMKVKTSTRTDFGISHVKDFNCTGEATVSDSILIPRDMIFQCKPTPFDKNIYFVVEYSYKM